MAGESVRATVLGFVGAVVVFAVLFLLVGVDDLLAQLAAADARFVGAVMLAAVGWLAAWSVSLRTVLRVLGVHLSAVTSFFLFAAATFANNVTPFGQAGGEPITALFISRTADTEYETGLAAIASVDTLNFVPSITLALIGVGYFATEVTLGRSLVVATAAVVVLAVGVPALVYTGWQRRYRLETHVVDGLTPLIRRVARVIPRLPTPTAETIERRINGFFRAIERVAGDPRRLAIALGFSAFGWFLQMVGLWLAFQAIGSNISFSVALFVVPIAAIAGITPLPGGAGGIESVLVVLLVAATGPAVGAGTATAAVIIFRGSVYWIPTVIGGGVTAVLSVRSRA